jgi:hypothetical protein
MRRERGSGQPLGPQVARGPLEIFNMYPRFRSALVSLLTLSLGLAAASASAQPPIAPKGAAADRAQAEPAPPQEKALGADAALVPILGSLGNGAGIGFGALGKFEYQVAPAVKLGARLGYVYHLDKGTERSSTGISEVPALVGVKYIVPGAKGLYLGGELGLSYIMARVTVQSPFGGGSATGSDSELKPSATAGLGAELGALDLRAAFYVLDLGNASETTAVMLGAGYRFHAF